MPEIIPNWHPMFVHFSIGLLTIASVLYAMGYVLRKQNLLIAARWNLWLGSLISIGTVLAGLYAYNNIAHDGALHIAMTSHRSWALPTAAVFLSLSLWAALKQRGATQVSGLFVLLMLGSSAALAVTGYKGAEVVYRHGGGVMRMPVINADGRHGSHLHSSPDDSSEHAGDHKETEVPHAHQKTDTHEAPVPTPDTSTDEPHHNHDDHQH